MKELDYRKYYVSMAKNFLGAVEGSSQHHEIIDTYNSHYPLARGYQLRYTDSWCAGFVSAIAIKCGFTNIIPTEVGTDRMIALFQQMNSWEENDAYKPEPGDIIFFDWDDDGVGDNQEATSHVGIVEKVEENVITTIEGNMNNRVDSRKISVNGRYIRGFGVPKYSSFVDNGTPFVDIDMDSYYYEAVKWAIDNKITFGVSETEFGPDQLCTRAQTITMIWRMAGEPKTNFKITFKDVPEDSYYSEAVKWGVEKNITYGVSKDYFGSDEVCTRAQIVTFLWRLFGEPQMPVLDSYEDVDLTAYYSQAVAWAKKNKITSGVDSTHFAPDSFCNRAQAVTFLYRTNY